MIKAHITFRKGCIASVQLSLSNNFSFEIAGATQSQEKRLSQWLHEYSEGSQKPFPEKLPLGHLTPFQRDALEELQQIPAGQTMSYQDLAEAIGRPKAARAIGGACHINPFPLLIPCHRIIRADGSIGGFAIDMEIKKRLLEFERSK